MLVHSSSIECTCPDSQLEHVTVELDSVESALLKQLASIEDNILNDENMTNVSFYETLTGYFSLC
jgi:hypothetical protein